MSLDRRLVVCLAFAVCTACGGSGGSGSDPVDAGADGSGDPGDVEDVREDVDDAATDPGPSDTGAPDSDDATDDVVDADAQADADDATGDGEADTDAGRDDATDDADASDSGTTDVDVDDGGTDADAGDTGTDVPVDPPPGMIKLVDPNAAPEAWFTEGAFGRSADVRGDLFVVGAPEDNERGVKAGAVVVGRRAGERWTTERVAPPELAAGDRFGRAVAISDGRLLVGASENTEEEERSGAAHILESIDGVWTITETMRARTPRAFGAYGEAVALDGGLAVIGGWTPDAGSGVVELWTDRGDAWERFLVLDAPSGEVVNQFGQAVAAQDGIIAVSDPSEPAVYVYRAPYDSEPIRVSAGTIPDSWGGALAFDGARLAVGAPGALVDDVRTGSVWLYLIDDLTAPETVLEAEGLTDGSRFGFGLDIDGDELVVGAYRAEARSPRSGVAYRYARNEGVWELEETLLPDTLADGDRFGIAMALEGGTVLATAIRDDTIAEDAGAAYLYDRSGADAPAPTRVFAGDPAAGDAFGHAVATDGTWVVIGAPFDDAAGANAGAAHLFRREGAGMRYAGRLPHESASDGQGFGSAVAIDGDWIAVGASSDDELGTNVGAVFTFRFDGNDWVAARRIRSPGPADNGDFGARVDLSGETLIIGAPARFDAVGSGGTWLYRRGEGDVWVYVSRLDAAELDLRPGPEEPAEFGASVLAAGTLFMAGVPARPGGGAAYTWAYTPGSPPGTLLPTTLPDVGDDARFGSALATNGGDLVVGAEGLGRVYPLLPGGASSLPGTPIVSPDVDDRFGASAAFAGPAVLVVGAPDGVVNGAAEAGRVWAYDSTFGGWSSEPRLYEAPDATPGLQLGASLSAVGGLVVAGAAGDDERGPEAGAAWLIIDP